MPQTPTIDEAKWPRQLSVLILLFCVFVTAISDNFLGTAVADNSVRSSAWMAAIAFLTVIFSPLQSGYSDYYCRRNSLVLALAATLIYVTLANYAQGSHWSILLLAVIFRSTLGNVLPISWAGVADFTHGHQFRFVLSLSVYALAFGVLGGLSIGEHLSSHLLFFPVSAAIVVALILFSFGLFKDRADSVEGRGVSRGPFHTRIKTEVREILQLCRAKTRFLALLAFIFSEISFYQIIFRIEVLQKSICLQWVPLALGIGYTVGTVLLRFVRATDERTSWVGLAVASLSITVLSIVLGLGARHSLIFVAVLSLYGFGFSWFTPSLFSLITPPGKPHLHGKIFGIVESSDGISILITYALLWVLRNVNCFTIFAVSTVLAYVSLALLMITLRHARRPGEGFTSAP